MSASVIDWERRARVNTLTREVLSIISTHPGITIDALHALFPSDGHTYWEVSGALDIVTGFVEVTRIHTPVEVLRGVDGARHLVLRDEHSPTPDIHKLHPLRRWQ